MFLVKIDCVEGTNCVSSSGKTNYFHKLSGSGDFLTYSEVPAYKLNTVSYVEEM